MLKKENKGNNVRKKRQTGSEIKKLAVQNKIQRENY
jgi:hypothetical protein